MCTIQESLLQEGLGVSENRIRYVDSEGWRWEVFEVRRTTEVDEPTPGSLYFFSRLGSRRLDSDYPATWARLPRPALEQLCELARFVD